MEATTEQSGGGRPGHGRKRLRLVRPALAVGGWIAVAAIALSAALVALVHVDAVSTWVVNRWVAPANPYPGTRLSVARVELSWPAHLRVRDLSLSREPGQDRGPEASVGLLEVRLRLRSLLRGQVEILQAGLFDVALAVTQGADSTWDAIAPFEGPADGGGGTPLRTGPIRVERASVVLTFASDEPGARPEQLVVEELTASIGGARLGAGRSIVTVDTLRAVFLPPGSAVDRVVVEGSGRLVADRLEVDGLTLRSGASDVDVRGVLLLPTDGGRETEEVDFAVSAAPLALRDVSGFARGVDPNVEMRAELRVLGSASRAEVTARATLSDGGTVELEGVFGPFVRDAEAAGGSSDAADTAIVQRLEARVSRLRLESLLGRGALGGVLEGTASVDLAGPSRDSLSGRVDARAAGLTLAGRAIMPASVSGTVDQGNADLRLVGGVPGWGSADLRVQGRPLDDRPTLRATGTFRQSDASAGEGPLATWGARALAARFDVVAAAGPDGRLGLSSLRSVDLEILAGSHRDRSVAGGRVRASWSDDQGTFVVEQPYGEGRIAAQGTLRDTWSGPGALSARATARLTNLGLASIAVDSVVLLPTLEAGALTARVEAWLGGSDAPGGSLSADVRGRPLDDEPFLEVQGLSFSGVDLAAVIGVSTRLDGTGRARIEGFDPAVARASAALALGPSTIGETPVDTAALVLDVDDGRVQVDAELSTPGGGLELRGGARPVGADLELNVEEARIRGLDLGAVFPDGAPTTDLNLDARVDASGPTWRTMTGRAVATVLPSTVGAGELTGGSLTVDAGGGVAIVSGAVTTAQGSADVSGRISLLEGSETVGADGELDVPDLAAFLGLDYQVTAAGRMRLDWSATDGLTLASELHGAVAGTTVDTLHLRGSLVESLLTVDTLRLRSEALRADGGGSLSLASSEEGAVAPGDSPSPAMSIELEVSDPLSLGDLPGLGPSSVSAGVARLDVGGVAGARTASLAVDLGPWETGGTAGQSARVRAEYGPRAVALDVTLPSARTGDTLVVALRADHRLDAREGVLRRLEVSSAAGGDWALAAAAPYTWGDELGIRGFELRSDEGSARVDGAFSRVGEHDLTLRLEGVQLAALGPLVGLEDVQLLVNGDLSLGGTVENPRAEGAMRLEVGPRGEPMASADAEVSLVDGRTTLDGRVRDPGGGVLTFAGTLPVSLPGARADADAGNGGAPPGSGGLELRAQSEAFDLAWVRGLVPGDLVLDLEGTLSSSLTLTGSTAGPRLEGTVGVQGGLVQLSTTSTRYQDMRLEAAFGPGELRVDALRARSGSGTAELQGVVGLSGLAPTTLDLSARLDRFLVSNAPPVTAVVSGDVVLRGTLEEPWLEGRLNPEGTTINLDDVSTEGSAQEVQLTAADYEMLEDYFGYSGDAESDVTLTQRLAPFGLRLSVSFDQDVFVTRFPQPRVSLECSGDLELDKEPGGPLRVVGTVTVLPERSYVRQFGRRFAIEEGTLTLDGEPADYAVDAQAQWELPSHSDPDQPEVVVNLDVSATAERTDLTLSSDPPMDESEIVSYLATGQAQGILASGDQASAANIGVATATGAVAGALESFAADRIALDVVEIAVDPVRGTTLVAGRYVSPDVYLGFRQPVSFGDDGDRNRTDAQLTEVELEYRWFRWLTLNLQTSASELRFYLRSRHDY